MPKPVISVVIIAHNRKQYIRRAIASVVNQTLDRGLYEIVVVKYFKDRKIDSYIKRAGAKNIYTREIPVGNKFAIGIEASRGDVIVFMEDDDIFYRRKLAKINEVFKDFNICYYHNSSIFIGENGRKIGAPGKRIYEPVVISLEHGDPSNINVGAMSCAAMRSELARRYAHTFKDPFVSPDIIMIFTSLASRKQLYFDSERLTGIGINQGSIMHPISSDYEGFSRKYIRNTKTLLHSFAKIRGLISEPKPERYRYVRWELSFNKAQMNVLSGREVYRLGLGDYLNMLMDWSIPLLIASIVFKISPKRAGSIYYRSVLKMQARERSRLAADRSAAD